MDDPITQLRKQASERVAELKRKLPEFARESKQERDNFTSKQYQKWKPALDLLSLMIVYADRTALDFMQQNNERAKSEDDQIFKVLSFFYFRVQNIVGEIETLMRSGYPIAAFARWRLLYEFSMFAEFIVQHGPEVARAYQEFQVMDTVDVMRAFSKVRSLSSQEEVVLANLETELQNLCTKYSVPERDTLGWTAPAFPTGRRTIHRLVRTVQDEYIKQGMQQPLDLWPFYVLSNTVTHASSMTTGLPGGNAMFDTLGEPGPSLAGLVSPAQVSVESLFTFMRAMLDTVPSDRTFIDLEVLNTLRKDVFDTFVNREDLYAARQK